MTTNEIYNALQAIKGVEDVKPYTLINNYGWTFTKNGKHYDLRRWVNCYGADLGWQVFGTKAEEDTHGFDHVEKVEYAIEEIEALV